MERYLIPYRLYPQDYMFFNQHKYARNLVEMNKHFELIVLCWESHQESPIHNHSVRFPVSSQIPFSCLWQFTLPDQGIDPPTLPLVFSHFKPSIP
jgi:hypothetical protein